MAHPLVPTALGTNNQVLPAHPAPIADTCTRLALEAGVGDTHVLGATTTLVMISCSADTYFLVGGAGDISATGYPLKAGVDYSFSVTPGSSLAFFSEEASAVAVLEA